jgi:hypothetical protein
MEEDLEEMEDKEIDEIISKKIKKFDEYVKENLVNDILDKISDGEELTEWENEYLQSYGTQKQLNMEDDIKPKENYIDGDTIEDQAKNLWDIIDEEEIREFIDTHRAYEYDNIRWERLPDTVQNKFIEFLKYKGHL